MADTVTTNGNHNVDAVKASKVRAPRLPPAFSLAAVDTWLTAQVFHSSTTTPDPSAPEPTDDNFLHRCHWCLQRRHQWYAGPNRFRFSLGDTDWILAGPVAQNVMDQSAKTTAEMSNLAAARHPPNYTTATGQPLTHYHSFFSELLSWRNPRMHSEATSTRKLGADVFQVPLPLPTPPLSPSSSRLGTSM
jgi:hypothetical protein